MSVIANLYGYLAQLDEQQFKKYCLIAAGVTIGLLGLYLYSYYSSLNNLKSTIGQLNKKRIETRELLERFELVKKQRKTVDQLLERDKNFKILDFYENILQSLQVMNAQLQEPQTASQDVLDGYTERTLYAQLVNLNMKKVTDILQAIEQNDRVYTKEIEIDRSTTKPQAVNLKITIGTLDKKEELLEE